MHESAQLGSFLSTSITSRSGDNREGSFLVQRISVLMHCFNSVLLHDSVPKCLESRHLLARDSMLSALYAIANPSVRLPICLSVCLSHGWISRKRLNVSSKFFHHLIGPTF